MLLRNLALVGLADGNNASSSYSPQPGVMVVAGNSMTLTAANFSGHGFPAFRLLSVDGGHTMEITLHDIMLASCVTMDGGIVILDDYIASNWIGVNEALMHFTYAQNRLIPFMMGLNKIYFTTASHAAKYLKYVESSKEFRCADVHASRRTLAGNPICFVPGTW